MTTTTPPTTTNEKGKKQKKENLWNDLKHAVEGFLKESQLNDTCVKTPQALRFARLAWNAFFVTMLIVCGIMLTLSCIDFASNGKITTMVEVDRAPDHFPAVSVCNLDPFATSDPLLQTTLSQQFNLIGGSLVSVSSEENTLGLDVESGWQLMKRYVLGLSASEKNKLGIDSSSGDLVNSTSIVSCVFDGELCSPDSVSFYNDFEYGNCFRFNANTSNVEEVSKRGARGGLQLVMYTGPANASVTRSRGFRLVVHSPSETYVNLDDEGVNAAPGLLTSVAVERNLYSRLPKPFSNCVADSLAEWPTRSRTMDLMLNELNMTVYSQRVCLEIDYQQALKAECGCIDPFAVRLFTMADVDDLCIEPVDMLCSRAFFANYYSRNSDVDQCPAKCTKFDYETSLSHSEFLTGWYVAYERTHSLSPVYRRLVNSLNEARQSLVAINVFYEDLKYKYIYESPKWTFEGILSELGGHLGLWIGMSLLSVYHLLELLGNLAFITIRHIFG